MQVSAQVRRGAIWVCAALVLCVTAMLAAAVPAALSAPATDQYIVVLKDDVAHPANVAHRHEENRGAEVDHIYGSAIEGYSAELTSSELKAIKQDPNVDYVERDGILHADAQVPSIGFKRAFGLSNPTLDIDEIDDVRTNADVAIIDTGVASHPDLNLVSRTNCTVTSGCAAEALFNELASDKFGHGTHVAGIVGAKDNNFGVVGTAPGARIWSVKAGNAQGSFLMSDVLAAVNWVTARSSEIEVVNMSVGCEEQGLCQATALREAIAASVDKGVVYVVSAGNEMANVSPENPGSPYGSPGFVPADFSDVITVSALADFDGVPGGLAGTVAPCEYGNRVTTSPKTGVLFTDQDDTLADFSNWGPAVDIAAPGTCINSTLTGSKYGVLSGTSMSAPMVTGAVAGLAAAKNPNNRTEVEAIRNYIRSLGNYEWTDLHLGWDPSGTLYLPMPDGVKEPLLDMHVPPPPPPTCPTASPPTSTETDPTPFRTSSGEFNVFARTTSGEQISFGRSGAGAWSVFNQTSVLPCHPHVQSTQSVLQTSNGELLVFARNTDNELVSFARTPAGAWSEYNLTSVVSGNPHIAGNPVAVKTSAGELLVFARTTNNELVSFSRSPAGAWSVSNQTAVVPGHPTILGSPSVFDWGGGVLSVFARTINNELVSFERTAGGAWSIFNETAVVPGHPNITESPAALMTTVGTTQQLLVFARTTNNELISFLREPSGAWSVYNETAVVPGNPKILGTPKPMITSAGELLVFARTTNNELVNFQRSPGGVWSIYNETAVVPGNPKILSSPGVFDWGGGVLSVFARSNNNELISFERTGAGAWSIYNETAVVPGHPLIE
jgi:formylmethanofuran dehydrogenase subunit D